MELSSHAAHFLPLHIINQRHSSIEAAMRDITPATNFIHTLMQSPPDASAWIAGGNNFLPSPGLPGSMPQNTKELSWRLKSSVFRTSRLPAPVIFTACTSTKNGVCVSPFTSAGAHYSRTPAEHPNHSGDIRFWATRVMPGWHFMTSVLRFRKLSENPSSFTGCRITLQRSPRATPANGLPAV